MVFSTVAGDASFVTAYAAEVQTAAGSEAAENPSPAEESGADSTEGAQNTINQESAALTATVKPAPSLHPFAAIPLLNPL